MVGKSFRNCPICAQSMQAMTVPVRGEDSGVANVCQQCDYHLLEASEDLDRLFRENQGEISRLQKAGLNIPSLADDFKNGTIQSAALFDDFLAKEDPKLKLLEIGCSLGYFLKLAKDKGFANVFGVEKNLRRAQFVEEELKIPCFTDLQFLRNRGLKFDRIFLLYVIEYVPSPLGFIQDLVDELLEKGGKIHIISPNLSDALFSIYDIDGYKKFFYEKTAVSYLSPKSVEEMAKRIAGARITDIETVQGYSLFNHANWFINQKPTTTRKVGGDYFVEDLCQNLSKNGNAVGESLAALIKDADSKYRTLLEKAGLGNQLRFCVEKLS